MYDAMNGTIGSDHGLRESLDTLARSLPPTDAATTIGGGSLTAPEPDGTVAFSSLDPSWLAGGALAKAGAPNPLPPRIVRCTGCGRVLTNPSRFCGYCGEPLDKTLI